MPSVVRLERFALLRAPLAPALLFAEEATSRLDPVGVRVIGCLQEDRQGNRRRYPVGHHDRDIAESILTRIPDLENKRLDEAAH